MVESTVYESETSDEDVYQTETPIVEEAVVCLLLGKIGSGKTAITRKLSLDNTLACAVTRVS